MDDRPGDFRQRLVLRLLRQNGERLHQRQAGIDHRGELPGEDHDVARPDPLAAGQRELDLLRRLPDTHQDQPVLLEVIVDLGLARYVDLALLDLSVRGVPRGVFEHRHR